MLSVILYLLRVSGNWVGIEHKKYPNISRAGSADTRIKQTGFKIDEFSVSLVKNPVPGSIYGIHDFLEDAPLEPLEHQSAVVKSDGKLFFKGFETEITPITLLSCYYDGVFEEMNLGKGVPVVISGREYYANEKYKSLYKAMRSIGFYNVSVVPESTCAAAYKAESFSAGEKIYIVNFQGSQIVGTLFEVENDSKGKKMIKKISSAPIEGVSDSEIEKMVIKAIRECLETHSNTPEIVSLLPYEKQEEWWTDITEFYFGASSGVNFRTVASYPRPEQKFYNKDGTRTIYAIDLLMDIEKLRNEILSKIKIEIPAVDSAHMYFLSYWELRKDVTTVSNGSITQMNSNVNAILRGISKIAGNSIGYVDDRAVTRCMGGEKSYREFMSELNYKSKVISTASVDPSEMQKTLKFLKEEEFKEFEELLNKEEHGAADIVGEYNLEYSKKLVDSHNKLVEENTARKVKEAVLQNSKKELERMIRKCRALEGLELEEELNTALEVAQELFDKVDENITSGDYDGQVLKLFVIFNRINKQRAAEEEERRKKEEEAEEKIEVNEEEPENSKNEEEPVENKESPVENEEGSGKEAEDYENLEEFFRKTMPKDGSVDKNSYNKFMDMLMKNAKKKGDKKPKPKENVENKEEEASIEDQTNKTEKTVL